MFGRYRIQIITDDQGSLIVNIASELTHQFKISTWPHGLHLFTFEQGKWTKDEIDPELKLASMDDEPVNCTAIRKFLEQIPAPVLALVKPFDFKQFTLISLFSEYPQLTDVFKHSPIICWLTIISATENNCSREYLASLLQKKRPLIVEKLCGVKSQEYVKFINKIQLLKAGKTEYKLIMKSILNAELVRSFKHWPSISLQALKVVDKYPCFIGSKLLNTMLDTQKSNHFNRMQFFYLHETIDDIKRLKRSLGKSLSEDDVKYIENPTQLENIHDKWTTRFNNSEQCRLHALRASRPAQRQQVHEEVSDENTIFPVCPIGDLANFIQIKCRDELSEEGIYMQHCVGSYAGKAERGASYIYKLLAPERATVEIQLTGNKILATQFKLVRNHKPSQQSYDYLREILTNYGSIEK